MGTDTAKKIEEAEKNVVKMEKRLEMLTKLFLKDGKIDDNEAKALQRVNEAIATIKEKIVALNKEQGVVDFSDNDEVITAKTRPYDDQVFRIAFSKSIKDWTQDGAIGLNSVRTYMIKEESPAGLKIMDLLPIVGMIFPASKLVAAAVTLAPIVEKAFNDALKATSAPKPSLNQIHSSWAEALVKLGNANHDSAYDQFVKDYKKANKVPADNDQAVENMFLPVCKDFANPKSKNMPSGSDVQKAFLTKVLSTVEDSYDWDDNAGDAEIELLELAGNWSRPEGQLDDVSEALVAAIKTVYRGAKVIELPVEINIIVRNIMGANMCEIQRKSRNPGDTGFKHKGGDEKIFKDFMKKKAYEIPYVRHLTVDT